MGEVLSLTAGQGRTIAVKADKVMASLKVGASMAVNGTCLTVTDLNKNIFKAHLSPETLKRATFSEMVRGERVNLERPLNLNDRLSGHLVTGHVDAAGLIYRSQKTGGGLELDLEIPREDLNLVIPKGSIAVDGVSLTVAHLRKNIITLVVIPHTAQVTTLGFKKRGEKINLEYDLIGKYIWRFWELQKRGNLNKEFLEKAGF